MPQPRPGLNLAPDRRFVSSPVVFTITLQADSAPQGFTWWVRLVVLADAVRLSELAAEAAAALAPDAVVKVATVRAAPDEAPASLARAAGALPWFVSTPSDYQHSRHWLGETWLKAGR